MRVTKFVHSCLLIETPDNNVLVDPGLFSWQAGCFDISNTNKLDVVVITHEHADHFSQEFVLALAEKFPDLLFVSTATVISKLNDMGINNTTTESVPGIEIFSTKRHADMSPLAGSPENIAVHVAGRITVGGDRHDLEESKEVLALPITAPWGSVRSGAEMVLRLNPKIVIPIHDWHWNDNARQDEYARSRHVYQQHGITLLKPVDAQPIEVP